MKKYQKFIGEKWNGKQVIDATFELHFFEEFVFCKCTFLNCVFLKTKFYRTSFRECVFTNCKFDGCKFYGEHTYLGPANFQNCNFSHCHIKDVQSGGAKFVETSFPNTQFENLNFYGTPKTEAAEFQTVDFSKAQLRGIAFYGVDLSTVTLPPTGIRVFQNPKDEFRRTLFAASGADASITDPVARLSKCPRRGLLILGDKCEFLFDPVGYSDDSLDEILSNRAEREQFNAIASKYEITSRFTG